MSSLKFIPPKSESWAQLVKFVNYLSTKKQDDRLDKIATKKILGERAATKFLSLEAVEKQVYYDVRNFESWLIGFDDFTFQGLNKTTDIEAELLFESETLPMGGISSLYYLIEIFDGKVISAKY